MADDRGTSTRVLTIRLLLAGIAVAILTWLITRLDLRDHIKALFQWIQGLGSWAPISFLGVYVLVVVLLLPGIVFTVGAGFVFGLFWGFVYVVIATSIGASISFFIGRHLLGPRAESWFRRRPRLRMIADGLAGEGWKLVVLTRLTPFFPFKLSNYVFGLARFRYRDFLIGTFFGTMPISLFNVYLGHMAADLASVDFGTRTPMHWVMYGGGLLVLVLVITYIARVALRVLKDHMPEEKAG